MEWIILVNRMSLDSDAPLPGHKKLGQNIFACWVWIKISTSYTKKKWEKGKNW